MELSYQRYSSSMYNYLTITFNFITSYLYFTRDWRDCKYWLLSLFKLVVEGIREKQAAGKGQDTLVEQLMKSVDEPSAHNYALLLLWASQANAVPVSG